MGKYQSIEERLGAYTRLQHSACGTCHIWTGYCQKGYVEAPETDGAYGRINLVYGGRSLKFPIHRVAKVLEEISSLKSSFNFYDEKDKRDFFTLYYAYSATGLSIDHLCKNTLCFNPEHLEWVLLSKNQSRKYWSEKKRASRVVLIKKKQTRHHTSLLRAISFQNWLQQIRSRKYRVK